MFGKEEDFAPEQEVREEVSYVIMHPVHVRARHAVFFEDSMEAAIAKAEALVEDGNPKGEVTVYEAKKVEW